MNGISYHVKAELFYNVQLPAKNVGREELEQPVEFLITCDVEFNALRAAKVLQVLYPNRSLNHVEVEPII